jgi:hypothetical protein
MKWFKVEWASGGFDKFESKDFATASLSIVRQTKRNFKTIKALSEIDSPYELSGDFDRDSIRD